MARVAKASTALIAAFAVSFATTDEQQKVGTHAEDQLSESETQH